MTRHIDCRKRSKNILHFIKRTPPNIPSPRNYQLDLFSTDDGYFEYSAVATNLALSPRALWYFAAGRGAQEKTIAELKGEFALDVCSHQSLRRQQRLAPALRPGS